VETPSGGITGLVTIPESTTASIAFAASNFLTDTGAYTVTVEAGYGPSFATIVTSASIIYTYINPCPTAKIVTSTFNNMTVAVGDSTSQPANLWYDSISGSATISLCGPLTWNYTINVVSAPNYVDSSMHKIFTLT
jgi:hypothetical protein